MPRKQKYKDRHYCDENNPHTCVVRSPAPADASRRQPACLTSSHNRCPPNCSSRTRL